MRQINRRLLIGAVAILITSNVVQASVLDRMHSSVNVQLANVEAGFELVEQGGDVYLHSDIRGSVGVGLQASVRDQRATNVSAGVNPSQGQCWEITPTTAGFWTEACSSGFHCQNGRKVISVASRSKMRPVAGVGSTQVIREWFSGKWYRTSYSC